MLQAADSEAGGWSRAAFFEYGSQKELAALMEGCIWLFMMASWQAVSD